MSASEIDDLVHILGKLPGLGPRSAQRVALFLLRHVQSHMLPLAQFIQQAAEAVRTCSACGNLDTCDPCRICLDKTRDNTMISVVEHVSDLWAFERGHIYKGVYQVLGGSLSALNGVGPDDLNILPLLRRLDRGGVKEVILALGTTVEGAVTTHWLHEKLSPYDVSISQVGQGIPMGGVVDALDDGTLVAALMTRRLLNKNPEAP